MTDFVESESTSPENKKTPRETGRYVPPRIVSYSAEELEKRVPRVTACESFFPSAENSIQQNRMNPMNPGDSL